MKKRKQVLPLLLTTALMFSSVVSFPVYAEDTDKTLVQDTNTYYFLAPTEWFDPEFGALNEDIGFFWWNSDGEKSENAAWPGEKMTPAPEIGDNVFKVENVPSDIDFIIFNTYVDAGNPPDPSLTKYALQSMNIDTEGYAANEVYEGCPATDSFDGMIYVFDMCEPYYGIWEEVNLYGGAWFSLDDYKNYEDFYGTYNMEQKKNGCTYYFAAPDEWFDMSKGALNEDVGVVMCNVAKDGTPKESEMFPGEKMTPAPEIGTGVFKITNVPYSVDYLCFYDYSSEIWHNTADGTKILPTELVYTRGYHTNTPQTYAPYKSGYICPTFDGMIYVLDMKGIHAPGLYTENSSGDNSYVGEGAWFTLDAYKDYVDYYGTYGRPDSPKDPYVYYYFLAPNSWYDPKYGSGNGSMKIQSPAGQAFEKGKSLNVDYKKGEHIFLIKVKPEELQSFTITSYNDPDVLKTGEIKTDGYNGNCPYDETVNTDSFDGWIYVLNNETDENGNFSGAWFKFDDYKNYPDYYGTYDFTPRKKRYTYYFLAPDEYIGSDGSVGAYWWTPEETAEYPGVGMKRESDIGENVFSVKVPSTTTAITFNAYITPESNNNSDYDHYDTVNIDLSGYKKGSDADNGGCPYNDEIGTDNFDGWIFVINHNDPIKDLLPNYHVDQGAWFKLDDYKNYDEYYGSYPERKGSSKNDPAIGDLDGDGTVTSSDALDILRISVTPESADDETKMLADIDGDEQITANDALAVLRYSVGMDVPEMGK